MSTLTSELRERKTQLRGHLSLPLFRHAYTLLLGSASISVLGLVYWLVAARVYPADIVGIGSAAISMLMLVSGLAQLGLPTVLLRYLPATGRSATRLVLWSYAAVVVVSAIGGVIAALAIGSFVGDLDFLASSGWWLAAFALSAVAWSIFALQDSVLTAFRLTHWVTIENTAFAIVKIVLLVGFAAFATTETALFASWVLPAVVAVLLVSVLVFVKALPEHRQELGNTAMPVSPRRLFRFASGNYGGSAISLAAVYVMPLLVASEAGATATAYFFVPWSIFVGLQLVAANMTTSLTVEAARDEEMLSDYCRRTLLQTVRLLAPVTLVLLVAGPYLLRVFGSEYAAEGTSLVRLLALAAIPNAIVLTGISVARIRHQAWLVLGAQVVVSALGVGLSFVLLPELGLKGAGIGWLIAQSLVAVVFLVGPFRMPIRTRKR